MNRTIATVFRDNAHQYPHLIAQYFKNGDNSFKTTTWVQLYQEVSAMASALAFYGVNRGSAVGLISENRKEWLIADLAVLGLGAADVPRGNDSTPAEIAYILSQTECRLTFVENLATAKKILSVLTDIPALKTIILIEKEDDHPELISPLLVNWQTVVDAGVPALQSDPDFLTREIDKGTGHDLATIIFTSGTTGEPKGVMLSHDNFLHQVDHTPELIQVGTSDIWLCVLPVWHSFERMMQYVAMGRASALAYSKPIGKVMLADFETLNPTWMASVPRIWESIMQGIYKQIKTQSPAKQALFHFFVTTGTLWCRARDLVLGRVARFTKRLRMFDAVAGIFPLVFLWPLKLVGDQLVFKKIRARLGNRFVAGISGGCALPPEVDHFFQAAGILLLEGYGITETSPVIGVRDQKKPVSGTVGPVFPGTEAKIIDDHGTVLPPGKKGVIHVRGPQVMLGYFKKPALTKEVITVDGWFNTGDLGMLSWDNELKILGRAKDTIVLRGGENVEPFPIEQRLGESPYIETAVVVGQDEKFLGALLVLRREALASWAKEKAFDIGEDLSSSPLVMTLLQGEVQRLVSAQTGFKSFERIAKIHLLSTEFEIGQELSAKQEVKRHFVYEKYRREIEGLFRS